MRRAEKANLVYLLIQSMLFQRAAMLELCVTCEWLINGFSEAAYRISIEEANALLLAAIGEGNIKLCWTALERLNLKPSYCTAKANQCTLLHIVPSCLHGISRLYWEAGNPKAPSLYFSLFRSLHYWRVIYKVYILPGNKKVFRFVIYHVN